MSDEASYMQDYRDEARHAETIRVPRALAGRGLTEEQIEDAIEDARNDAQGES